MSWGLLLKGLKVTEWGPTIEQEKGCIGQGLLWMVLGFAGGALLEPEGDLDEGGWEENWEKEEGEVREQSPGAGGGQELGASGRSTLHLGPPIWAPIASPVPGVAVSLVLGACSPEVPRPRQAGPVPAQGAGLPRSQGRSWGLWQLEAPCRVVHGPVHDVCLPVCTLGSTLASPCTSILWQMLGAPAPSSMVRSCRETFPGWCSLPPALHQLS